MAACKTPKVKETAAGTDVMSYSIAMRKKTEKKIFIKNEEILLQEDFLSIGD